MSSFSTIVDQEDIKAIAVNALNDDKSIEIIDYYAKPYSKHKIGFLGNHQKLEITVKQNNNAKPIKLNFFMKSILVDSETQAAFIKRQRVFNLEAEFFNSVMPHLLEVMSVADIEPWAPKCYLANENFIVLEDIRIKGYTMYDTVYFQGDTLKSTVKAMAHLHASSILAEKKLGKSWNELYPNVSEDMVFSKEVWPLASIVFESFITEVAQRNGRSSKYVRQGMEQVYRYRKNDKDKHPVMCHGDSWPNNAMFNDSKPPNCILVDYQTTKYAARMYDVAQLIYLCTNSEIRKTDEKETIKAYWNELCETLSKCDPDAEKPTCEALLEEYEDARLAAQLNAIIYFPLIRLSKNMFAEYENDVDELFKKIVFRTEHDCVLELMDRYKEYNDKITEIIIEFLNHCENLETLKS